MTTRALILLFGCFLAYYTIYAGDSFSTWSGAWNDTHTVRSIVLLTIVTSVAGCLGILGWLLAFNGCMEQGVLGTHYTDTIGIIVIITLLGFFFGVVAVPFSAHGSFWGGGASVWTFLFVLGLLPVIMQLHAFAIEIEDNRRRRQVAANANQKTETEGRTDKAA